MLSTCVLCLNQVCVACCGGGRCLQQRTCWGSLVQRHATSCARFPQRHPRYLLSPHLHLPSSCRYTTHSATPVQARQDPEPQAPGRGAVCRRSPVRQCVTAARARPWCAEGARGSAHDELGPCGCTRKVCVHHVMRMQRAGRRMTLVAPLRLLHTDTWSSRLPLTLPTRRCRA